MIARFLRWLGPPRAPTPPIPPQPPAERDWAVGDRARCIAQGTWFDVPTRLPSPGPSEGQVLRVIAVFAHANIVWLGFVGFEGFVYPAGHFRKLRPCSAAFREQLRNRAPAPAPELVE